MSKMTATEYEEARRLALALYTYLDKHGTDADIFRETYVALEDLVLSWKEANGQFGVGA